MASLNHIELTSGLVIYQNIFVNIAMGNGLVLDSPKPSLELP